MTVGLKHFDSLFFQVWVRKGDGSKTKLYIGQLQKGKYKIRKT